MAEEAAGDFEPATAGLAAGAVAVAGLAGVWAAMAAVAANNKIKAVRFIVFGTPW
jgi:anaerobic selenocysteine-containing dehydrogenase